MRDEPLRALIVFTGSVLVKFSIVVNLYFPGYLPGQELAPSLTLEGCQRVRELDLSPLLYKSKPCEGIDHGIATDYGCKYMLLVIMCQIYFLYQTKSV
jgi:hypothetical protein